LYDLRHVPAGLRCFALAGDEGARAQPDRVDDEHLPHVLPEIERATVNEAAKHLSGDWLDGGIE
jgi:hypothetical protein